MIYLSGFRFPDRAQEAQVHGIQPAREADLL